MYSFASNRAVALLAGLAMLGGVFLPAAPTFAQTGTLRMSLTADIRSSDPGVNRDTNTDTVMMHVVEGLVAIREDTSIGPLLAQQVDVSKDGKTYTFKLRTGVPFHNGELLTADDVVWTWKRYLAPSTQWRCLNEFDGHGAAKILDVAAIDPLSIRFTLDKPSALFLTTMARSDCGGSGIYHRSSVAADGKWKAPIGTGPFKFGDWKRGQFVELLRFDRYASRPEGMDGFTGGKKAEVERIRFMVIPDMAAAKAAILSGAIDIIPDIGVAELGDVIGHPGVHLEKASLASLSGILIQTRDPLMQDVRMRRALAMAIDTPEVVRGVTNALAKPNNSAIPDVSPYHSAAQNVGFGHDMAEVKKLLNEAGYRGQPIKMLTNKRYVSMFDTALLAQASAARAGIVIEVEVLEWATQLDRYSKGNYQTMAFSYSSRLDPSLVYDMFTGPKDSQPRKLWDSPDVQALLLESMQTADKSKRQAIFDELHRRMLADVPIIPLFNGLQLNVLSDRVVGFRGWQAELPRLWNVRLH